MRTIKIDLSALSDIEKGILNDSPEVLDADLETVCCLYMRYSSDKQTEQSIEGQLRELVAYCKQHKYRISAIYVDRAISAHANMEKRPAFQRMLADSAHSDWTIVMVYKLDRFSRRREDSAVAKMRLRKNGCTVESAKEAISKAPEGVILESLLEGLAEYYSAELSQKVKRGMRESAQKGLSTGGCIPLGYKSENKKIVADPVTAPLVQEIFQRYVAGATIASICKDFNARGIRTTKGAKFTHASFNTLLRNKKYIGTYTYGDIEKEGAVPMIIDTELFEAAQVRLGKQAHKAGKEKAKVPYLLSGKMFCGHCGSLMVGECGRSKTGAMHYYYTCSNRKRRQGCTKKAMRKDWIEGIVADSARAMLTDEVIDYVATQAEKQSEQAIRETTSIPMIQQQIKDVETKIKNLTAAIESAGASAVSLVTRISELEAQRKDLERAMQNENKSVIRLTKPMVTYWLEQVRAKSEAVGDQNAMLLDMLVNSVTVWDRGPDGIDIETAYNLTGESPKTVRIPPESVPFVAPKGSDTDVNGSPKATNPNSIFVVGLVFVQRKRHALP